MVLTKQLSGLLIIGTVLFSACQSSETVPTDRVSIGLHQSARLSSDVIVRVDSIQDSRCPQDVNCIWAGQANVKLTLSKNTDSSAVRLTLGASLTGGSFKQSDSTTVSLNSSVYQVILREVHPYPNTQTTGQTLTAVIQVTKL